MCAIICGAEGWDDIELFGQSKESLLKEFFPYKYEIPSDDTLRRFFRALDPEAFRSCFIKWMQSLDIETTAKVIVSTGKQPDAVTIMTKKLYIALVRWRRKRAWCWDNKKLKRKVTRSQ